jgi:hypothetical protein
LIFYASPTKKQESFVGENVQTQEKKILWLFLNYLKVTFFTAFLRNLCFFKLPEVEKPSWLELVKKRQNLIAKSSVQPQKGCFDIIKICCFFYRPLLEFQFQNF